MTSTEAQGLRDILDGTFQEARETTDRFLKEQGPLVLTAAVNIFESLRQGNTVYLVGNGGSAAQAQHIAAEFVGRFKDERRPLPAHALTVDGAVLTAIANDYGFEYVFSRQLQAHARGGDIVLLLSTSGSSQNVVRAAEVCRAKNILTIGLMGQRALIPPVLERLVNIALITHGSTARIQETHLLVGHVLCDMVEQLLANAAKLPSRDASFHRDQCC